MPKRKTQAGKRSRDSGVTYVPVLPMLIRYFLTNSPDFNSLRENSVFLEESWGRIYDYYLTPQMSGMIRDLTSDLEEQISALIALLQEARTHMENGMTIELSPDEIHNIFTTAILANRNDSAGTSSAPLSPFSPPMSQMMTALTSPPGAPQRRRTGTTGERAARQIFEERYNRDRNMYIAPILSTTLEIPDNFVSKKIKEFNYNNNLSCSICYEKFGTAPVCMIYDCGHIFHCNCIGSWRERYTNNCPLCRKDIRQVLPIELFGTMTRSSRFGKRNKQISLKAVNADIKFLNLL